MPPERRQSGQSVGSSPGPEPTSLPSDGSSYGSSPTSPPSVGSSAAVDPGSTPWEGSAPDAPPAKGSSPGSEPGSWPWVGSSLNDIVNSSRRWNRRQKMYHHRTVGANLVLSAAPALEPSHDR